MTIHQYLKSLSLNPNEIEALVEAYELTLKALGLTSRDDAIAEIVTKTLIEVSRSSIRDPVQLSQLVMERFGLSRVAVAV